MLCELRRLALAPPRASSPPSSPRWPSLLPQRSGSHGVKKAKLDERRRHPPAPRQPRRQNSRRPNFLISPPLDDGRNWRILSAGIVERLAIIQPDVGDWEMDFEVPAARKGAAGGPATGGRILVHGARARHVTPEEVPGPDEQDDPDELVGAGFHLAPRESGDEDDAMNNSASR
uniref:Uncharacterized protein n=1 Tax=Peronospora matthiolae TaxID=2874970 RepID=A0AAV1TX04_9STRA